MIEGMETFKIGQTEFRPGDIIILKTPQPVSEATAEAIKKRFETNFPGMKCLVLSDGLEIEIMRKKQ